MAGVHSWRLQLTSVADVLSVYFCLARSLQGLLPEDLPTLPPDSCGQDPLKAPPTPACKPLPFLKLSAVDFCPGLEGDGPRSWWPVCDSSRQRPYSQSARRILEHKPVPVSVSAPVLSFTDFCGLPDLVVLTKEEVPQSLCSP